MKKRVTIVAAFLLITATAFSQAFTKESIPFIDVNGRAEKEFIPDQIFLRLNVVESEIRGRKTLESVERELFKGLEGIGLDLKEDLSLSDMQVTIQKYFLKKDNVSAEKEYIIRCNSSKQLTDLYELLTKLKLTNVTIIRAKLSNPDEAIREVLKEATKNAKLNAEAIASAVDHKIGRALHIQSYAGYPQELFGSPVLRLNRAMAMSDAQPAQEEYQVPEFRKITITQSVSVKFELLSR